MKKALKYTFGAVLVSLVVIQFIKRPERISEPANDDDIINALEIEGPIASLLKSACYDCHSDQPRYPWYASVAPVSWRIAEHIEHGRDELNFSKWATYSARRRDHKLEEMIEEVEEGHMPLPSYVRMHSDARLNTEQITSLKTWINTEREKIAAERAQSND
ncbi:hypothetical protein BFP97_07685 [Roseivirga sp. 4D4]|uniref:heme-binding domain-containing protein n=1 Tax=Roseivirga sp. 4D4 TaxID=1889784 RepID=UPI00085294D3|nr:heme-binding domain-containing protein [Roseivirga sp. 4D4]OEK01406.1 hypothetical protein BFP97_07685 [Roseivirga sp. 4D4]